jgi:hypothetical protein
MPDHSNDARAAHRSKRRDVHGLVALETPRKRHPVQLRGSHVAEEFGCGYARCVDLAASLDIAAIDTRRAHRTVGTLQIGSQEPSLTETGDPRIGGQECGPGEFRRQCDSSRHPPRVPDPDAARRRLSTAPATGHLLPQDPRGKGNKCPVADQRGGARRRRSA